MSSNQAIYNFATIGEVFDDGVTLIFDGQDAATEKHYKVNTSIIFQPGDRVKILADSGTYVVEYVVGAPKSDASDSALLPAGGEKGKSLIKSSDDDYAVEWGAPDGNIPTGGTAGQCLVKDSSTNYDVSWGNPVAASVVNQYRPTYATFNIQLQTDFNGNFYIRYGTGTWKQITVT